MVFSNQSVRLEALEEVALPRPTARAASPLTHSLFCKLRLSLLVLGLFLPPLSGTSFGADAGSAPSAPEAPVDTSALEPPSGALNPPSTPPPTPPQNSSAGADSGATESTSPSQTPAPPSSDNTGDATGPQPTTPSPSPTRLATDAIPSSEIQVITRALEVSVVRRSTSTRTYLFHLDSGEFPAAGRILLLREGERPVMAFRVIKTYPEKSEIAVRRVRRYRGHRILDVGKSYLALEKAGEILPPPPTPKEEAVDLAELEDRENLNDLKRDVEGAGTTPATAAIAGGTAVGGGGQPVSDPLADPSLERFKLNKKGEELGKAPIYGSPEGQGILEFDPELDAATTPPPTGDATNSAADHADDVKPLFDDSAEESAAQITVEEVPPLEVFKSALSLSIGLQRNLRYPSGSSYFTAGALRYGYTFGKSMLVHTAHLQDSITAEGGVGFYKLINYVVSRDAYTVMPLLGSVRYNLHFGENLGVFLYGGVTKGLVISSASGTTAGQALLSSMLPALGGGFLLKVGPSWEFRADVGLDMTAAGMMLRF